jgi:signal transduction histidine kinase/AmiR/NasT family two-component response regulator
MKIKTSLLLAGLAPALMAAVVGVAVFVGDRAGQSAHQRGKAIAGVIRSVNELNSLVGSYLLYHEERPRQQFLAEHGSLLAQLESVGVRDPEQRQLLNAIRENAESIKTSFLGLVANHEAVQRNPGDATLRRSGERVAGQLHVKARQVVADGVRLERLADDEILSIHATTNNLVVLLIMAASAAITAVLVMTMRSVAASLTALRQGTEAIGAGDLGYRIGLSGADELAALGRSMDGMAEKLQIVTMSKAAAEAANEAKSQFLANMSHELRTPMNAILGMIDVALPKAGDPVVQDCLKTAKGSADLLLTLLDDLLDSAKIESGKLELESAPFSVRRMLDQITRVLSVRASEKGLCFCCRVPNETPDAVVGDRMRLQQVLLNLAGNAIKFTERGEVEIGLRTVESTESSVESPESSVERRASSVRRAPAPYSLSTLDSQPSTLDCVTLEFAVRDTGIGISPAALECLFAPFAQADASMTRRFGGTGLGLSICKSLAELMGGWIWVESEVGKGSIFHFTVRLPLAKELPADLDAPMAIATKPSRQLRILLAEDNPANQMLAKYILQERGHVVEIASDGQRAVSLSERNCYDVILMDVQMPGTDGLAATAAIRKREKEGVGGRGQGPEVGGRETEEDEQQGRPTPNPSTLTPTRVPIIAMTAHAMKSDRERCLAAGMDSYLSKPIDRQKMIALVEGLAAWSAPAAPASTFDAGS